MQYCYNIVLSSYSLFNTQSWLRFNCSSKITIIYLLNKDKKQFVKIKKTGRHL